MLFPVIVDIVKDDVAAQCLGYLLALCLVGLLEVHGKGELALAVGDRDGDVLIHLALLLVHLLDNGVHLLRHGVHTAGVDLLHVLCELFGNFLGLGIGKEFFVKAKVDGKLCDDEFLEFLVGHAFRLLCKNHCGVSHHVLDVNLYPFTGKSVAAAGIDGLPLVVHHVVILQRALAVAKVVLFHLLLCRLNALGKHSGDKSLIVLHAKAVYHGGNPFGAELAHEVIFQRNVEAAGAGVSLTSGTSSELSVNTAAVVTGCADDGKTAGLLHLRRELDIGTTACHVGGDGHVAGETGVGNDFGLAGVLLGVEDIGLDASHTHHAGKEFGGFDVGGTYQHRPSCVGEFHNLVDDGVELRLLGLVDDVVLVVPDYWPVGGNHHHIQLVDAPEFACFRLCGTGHTGKLVIHTEVVLESNGCEGLGCSLNLHVFLSLNGLVQTVRPSAAFHDTAGGLVHNLHLVVHDDVVDILGEHCVCLEQLDYGVDALALEGEFLHEFVLLLCLFFGRERRMSDLGYCRSHVREDEEVRVGNAVCEHLVALVGHVHGVQDF